MAAKRRVTSNRRSRSSARGGTVPNFFDRLEWRSAGPYRGGRVGAVAGDPRERNTFYFGSTGGGVWKTMDGGQYWENTTDRFFKRASVGGIAVAESDPDVMYVGMGESCIRGNVSHGDGVYRSTDAGKTWSHLGLERTRTIAKVRVHPQDADLVYVAALGHAHGPNPERGVLRSRDGGKTWQKVLYRGPKAGAADLSMDPNNPRILYATFWEAIRRPWELVSGGPGSGMFRSIDAGKTFERVAIPHGDHHDLWIDPKDPRRIINGNDGGATISLNGGEAWSSIYNQPTAEFYHVTTDTRTPYRVYGAQQDNTTITVPSRSAIAGITRSEAYAIGGGESGPLAVRPDGPALRFAG